MTIEINASCDFCRVPYSENQLKPLSKKCMVDHLFCNQCIQNIVENILLTSPLGCPACRNAIQQASEVKSTEVSPRKVVQFLERTAPLCLSPPTPRPESPADKDSAILMHRAQSIIKNGIKIQFSSWGLNNEELQKLKEIDKSLYIQLTDYFKKQVEVFLWEAPKLLLEQLRWAQTSPISAVEAIRLILLLNDQDLEWIEASIITFIFNHGLRNLPFKFENFDPQYYIYFLFEDYKRPETKTSTIIYSLAFCYEFGVGVEVNIEKALKYYKELEACPNTTIEMRIKFPLINTLRNNWGSKEIKQLKEIHKLRPENPILNLVMAKIELHKSLVQDRSPRIIKSKEEFSIIDDSISGDSFLESLTRNTSERSIDSQISLDQSKAWTSISFESYFPAISPEEEKANRLLAGSIEDQFNADGINTIELEILYEKNEKLHFRLVRHFYRYIKAFIFETPETFYNEVQIEPVLSVDKTIKLVLLLAKQRSMQAETPIAKSVQNFLNNHPINYGPAVFKKENYFKQLEMFHNSSDGLIPEFAHRLAFCYEYGVGVKKDMKKAMSLYKLAKKGKHIGGLTKWSLLRQSDDRSHKSKLKSLEKVIQATNNPIALYLSGKMSTASSSVEDKNRGIGQIVEAAKMGIYAAKIYLKSGKYPGQVDSQAPTLPSPRENKLRRKSVI